MQNGDGPSNFGCRSVGPEPRCAQFVHIRWEHLADLQWNESHCDHCGPGALVRRASCDSSQRSKSCCMNFDSTERAVLGQLADVLIPTGEGFPSASQAGVADEGLDRVLSFRPDLGEGLKRLIAAARARSAKEFVTELQEKDPVAFGLLSEFVPGAYFLNESVRERLGYAGQTAHPIQ